MAPDGTPVLSPEHIKEMQLPRVECPATALASHWGLGWMITVVGGRQGIAHGGNTIGQSAYFSAVPDRRVAVALLTNAGGRHEPSDDLVRELLAELAAFRLPPRAVPSGEPGLADLSRFVGRYERHGVETSVELDDGQLRARITMSGPLAASMGLDEPITFALHPAVGEEALFVATIPEFGEGWVPLRFYAADASGRPRFLHTGGRASRRTD